MDIADALDETMVQNARREIRVRDDTARNTQAALDDKIHDEEATRKAFDNDAREVVRQIPGEVLGAEEHGKGSAGPNPSFQRVKRSKRDYGAVLGIKRNYTTC